MNKNFIKLSPDKIKNKFREELPWLSGIAAETSSPEAFVVYLKKFIEKKHTCSSAPSVKDACRQILTLVDYEGETVHELSYGKNIRIDTLASLWSFLNGNILGENPDIFIDMYFLFMQAEGKYFSEPYTSLRSHMRK